MLQHSIKDTTLIAIGKGKSALKPTTFNNLHQENTENK